MELNEALNTLHKAGFITETRLDTKFTRQTFKDEPDNPLITAYNALLQLNKSDKEWTIYAQDVKLKDLYDSEKIKAALAKSAEDGYYLTLILLRKYIDEEFISIELMIDIDKNSTPHILVALGDDYGWVRRQTFKPNQVDKAIKCANKMYDDETEHA